MQHFTKYLLISLSILYIVLQFLLPALGFSLELNFDRSCYTGSLAYVDRMGSTCSGSGIPAVGFPFVINNSNNYLLEQALVLLVDVTPLALLVLLASGFRVKRPNANN